MVILMDEYCNCTINSCGNKSKNMYSVDYDGLIDSLTHTRDEIDTLIKQLENRKSKDKVINDILSSEYEDEEDIKEEDIIKAIKRYRPVYYYYPYYYDYVGDLPKGWWSIFPTVTRTHFKNK